MNKCKQKQSGRFLSESESVQFYYRLYMENRRNYLIVGLTTTYTISAYHH